VKVELVAGLLIAAAIWTIIAFSWRRGLELFILYTPFAGAVELWMYPAQWAVLVKDLLFVAPAYAGLILSGEMRVALNKIPRSFASAVALFAGIVIVQALNPLGIGCYGTLIGLKVWLFYVPGLIVGCSYVSGRASLLRLSRLMIGLIWLPCGVAILQWILSLTIGYQRAIGLFYGDAAVAATQQFAHFAVGLIRIPATFSYPAQYFNYILCMFVPVLGSVSIEDNRYWRGVRQASLFLLCVGGFMTGERASFVMMPLMLGTFSLLRRGAFGVAWTLIVAGSALSVVLSITGIDASALLHMESDLSRQYAGEQAGEIQDALEQTWLGRGVGTNTGATRVASDETTSPPIYEGYYARAIAELGLPGCLITVLFQCALFFLALKAHFYLLGSDFQPYADAIAAMALVFLVYNYKGAILSLDPANMFYWLYAGVLFSITRISWEEEMSCQHDVSAESCSFTGAVGSPDRDLPLHSF
jgi:hypothetical protein